MELKGKNVINIFLLFFVTNFSFAQEYFLLESSTDKYKFKNYELNTIDLYGVNKSIYIYNILMEDLLNKYNPNKTLALFSVLPNVENDEDWEVITLDSIKNKIISISKLRQMSDRSLYQRDDIQYGFKTKYWNEYKIIIEHSGKYFSPKNCLLQFYFIQNRSNILNQPYNTINILQSPYTISDIKKLYTNTSLNNSFPMDIPPNDKYFDRFRDRREFLSNKFSINQQIYYQFWTFTDWGKTMSKVIKDPHKAIFAYERGIDRFVYNPHNLIVGGSYDFYFYYYKNEFGIESEIFQKNILNEKITIDINLK